MTDLPSGTVTFLFTDVGGSTKLAQHYPDEWETLRARQNFAGVPKKRVPFVLYE